MRKRYSDLLKNIKNNVKRTWQVYCKQKQATQSLDWFKFSYDILSSDESIIITNFIIF